MPKPYPMMRDISIDPTDGPTRNRWMVEFELADTPNVSAQSEKLTIRTRVAGPLPDHPQGLHLAALLRVRDLLTEQIEAMQSP